MPAGRPKKPIALKRIDGTFREDRDGGTVEIEHVTEDIPAPKTIKDKEAKKLWNDLSSKFTESRMLTDLDLPLLELMCVEYQRYLMYEKEIEKSGHVLEFTNKADHNYLKENPYLKLREKALKRFTEIASKFGMTPSDRAKVVQVKGKKANDGFDDL